MSRTQFVHHGDGGFWAYDVALSIWIKHLVDAADRRLALAPDRWLGETAGWWRVVASINDYGFDIESAWTAAQLGLFVELADEATATVAGRRSITADEVSGWSLVDGLSRETRGEPAVDTAPIVALGRAIIALAGGTLPHAPVGTVWYYGTAVEPDTIGMRHQSARSGDAQPDP